MDILFLQSRAYLASDFYQHGDMDSLEVGNTNGRGDPQGYLTVAEMRTQFTAWALLKSHLLISTDWTKIDQDSLNILLNKEIIQINQDPNVGKPLSPFRIGYQENNNGVYTEYNATYPR
jgi:alpha-galactosidase